MYSWWTISSTLSSCQVQNLNLSRDQSPPVGWKRRQRLGLCAVTVFVPLLNVTTKDLLRSMKIYLGHPPAPTTPPNNQYLVPAPLEAMTAFTRRGID